MNCLDESNPDTRPDEASGRPQTTRALSAAMAAIEAAAAMAQAAGGQMPDYTDTPGPGKRAARTRGLPIGSVFESPESPPNTLPALPPGFTWDDPDPDGPSFRAPAGVVCCCASVTQAVETARRWAGR